MIKTSYQYIFECDYGSRTKEAPFLKDLLNTYDKNYLPLVGLHINNNPYCLSFHIILSFEGDVVVFEDWLKEKYPEKLKRHNIFLKDALIYNSQTLINASDVDFAITEHENGFFLFPEKQTLIHNKPQYKCLEKHQSKVFISHSSKDKHKYVHLINAYLQANDIATWVDSFEIDIEDNFESLIHEGIDSSEVGLFILTDHFFNSESGWPLKEFELFINKSQHAKNVILLDCGMSQEFLLPEGRNDEIISWGDGTGLKEVALEIKKRCS